MFLNNFRYLSLSTLNMPEILLFFAHFKSHATGKSLDDNTVRKPFFCM